MMAAGSGRNWGGARAGAGRKPETLSVRQVRAILDSVEKRAKEEKREIQDMFLDIVYDSDAPRREKLAAGKLIWEYTIAKLQEGGETDTALGPVVFLPKQHPRFEIVGGKKKGKGKGDK